MYKKVKITKTMEENKKEQTECCGNICEGKWCKKWCGMGKGCPIFRWILGVIILIAVFSLGIKVGEFKSSIYGYGGGFGWRMHRGVYPMMFYGYNNDGDDFNSRGIMGGCIQYPQQKASSTQK